MEIHVSVKGVDTAFIHHMAEVVATNSTENGKRMPDEIYLVLITYSNNNLCSQDIVSAYINS